MYRYIKDIFSLVTIIPHGRKSSQNLMPDDEPRHFEINAWRCTGIHRLRTQVSPWNRKVGLGDTLGFSSHFNISFPTSS
jgi:hypothetical protein